MFTLLADAMYTATLAKRGSKINSTRAAIPIILIAICGSIPRGSCSLSAAPIYSTNRFMMRSTVVPSGRV